MIWVALTLGLIGSLHCLGMCGPLALALPVGNLSQAKKTTSIFTYNFGRVFTYTILGAILGFFGYSLKLIGWLQSLSILMGALLIIYGLMELKVIKLKTKNTAFSLFTSLKAHFSNLLKQRSLNAFFAMGLLNGLLPCGMVYSALIGSLVASSWYGGASFMFFFGLGTVPAMFALPLFKSIIQLKWQKQLVRIIPYTFILLGCILVLRGANLNIPYLSPDLSPQPSLSAGEVQTINCH